MNSSAVNGLYFAYGSNMDRSQMLQRCPGSIYRGLARLDDYQLVFNRKGTYHSGAVASVIRAPGQVVHGVVWEVIVDEILGLDRIENPDAYTRSAISVAHESGRVIEVFCYVAHPEESPPPPDPEYVRRLLLAAEAADLPREYIARLTVSTQA